MLSNTLLKFAGLASALMLAVGCQHQGTGPASDVSNTGKAQRLLLLFQRKEHRAMNKLSR